MPSAKVPIWAYHLLNPNTTSSVEIEVTNSLGYFYFEDEDTGNFLDSTITLCIPDTEELGFVYCERDEETQACLHDLITAINLNLEKVGITNRVGFIEEPNVEYAEKEIESLEERRYAKVGAGLSDSIDEKVVIETFEILQEFDRRSFDSQSSKERINIIKALELYDNALSSPNRYTQHMLLYMALEHAVLYKENSKVSGDDLDEKMERVTGIDKVRFADTIRTLYNRQKHPDRTRADVKRSLRILGNKELYTEALNRVLSEAIRDRVKVLTK